MESNAVARYPIIFAPGVVCFLSSVFCFLFSDVLVAVARADDNPPIARSHLLPNGWTVSPAGKQVPLTDLPLNILPLPDNQHVLVTTNGYNQHELSVVDLSKEKCLTSVTVKQSWFGLVMSPDQKRIWWSGGGTGTLHNFELRGEQIVPVENNE